MQYLLENQTENGSGDAFNLLPQETFKFYGNFITVYCWGDDFDGCTVTLEVSPDDGTTWMAVGTDTTFTAAGHGNFIIGPSDVKIRGTVSSVGGSTDVNLAF